MCVYIHTDITGQQEGIHRRRPPVPTRQANKDMLQYKIRSMCNGPRGKREIIGN